MRCADSLTGEQGKKVVTLSVIVFLAFLSYAVGAEDLAPSQKDKCPVCGMFVSLFADWNARIDFNDQTGATFDGAKDMFKYYLDIKKYNPEKTGKDITSISVKDYYSKTSIDARQAFFVIWSDVYGPMGHEPIPFEKAADAKQFLKEHRGKKIIRFRDVTPRLMTSLDNP
jgi:copper chaperone NosL